MSAKEKPEAKEYGLAASALAHPHPAGKKPPTTKPQPEAHVKKLHSGGFLVTKHFGDGKPSTDHGAKNLAEVSSHLEDHMGTPNEGEGEPTGGADAGEQCPNCSDKDCPGCGGK